jgi:DNA-binding protein YbaB
VGGGIAGADFGPLISQTLRALREAGAGAAEPADDAEPTALRGNGVAADGLIRASAAPGGLVESLELDPRVLRWDTGTLTTEIVAAVNAALADLRAQLQSAVAPPDPGALAQRLEQVQQASTRQMQAFLQALTDAQEHIAAAGRR